MSEVSFEQTTPKSSSSLKLVLVALGIVALVGVSAYAGYWYGKQQVPQPLPTPGISTPPVTEVPEATPPAEVDETAGWKSYTSDEYGFSIRYPEYLLVEEERAGTRLASVRFEGLTGEYLGFSIEKDFVGGWMGKEVKQLDVDVDGENGKAGLWLGCDSAVAAEWEECNEKLSLSSYDSATVKASFARDGKKWYLFYGGWKKGERDNDGELNKVKTLLSTFKFLD